jgi:competence protein ComEC
MTPSKIFFFLCLSIIFGVAYGSFFSVSYAGLFVVLLFIFLSVVVVLYNKPRPLVGRTGKEQIVLLVCGMFFLAGAVRYATYEQLLKKDNDVSVFAGSRAAVAGMVDADPSFTQQTQQVVFRADTATVNGEQIPVSGYIKLILPPYPRHYYGDILSAGGKITSPQEEYTERERLAKDGIFSVMLFPKTENIGANGGVWWWNNIFMLRRAIIRNIERYFPEPHAAFLSGLLIGEKQQLPQDFKNDLSRSGTSHLVALSGYNITIVGAAVSNVFSALALAPGLVFWGVVAAIVAFTVFCGAQASLVRAAIMGSLVLFAKKKGRAYNVTNALLGAAAIMVLINPKILRFDVSFQLSFLAMMGMVYFAPVLKEKMKRLPDFLNIKDTLAETVAAQLLVLPLLVFYFDSFSMVAPLANIFILVTVPLAMFLGFVFLVGSFISSWIAWPLSIAAWAVLAYQIAAVKMFSALPFAQTPSFAFAVFGMVVLYGMLGIIFFRGRLAKRS